MSNKKNMWRNRYRGQLLATVSTLVFLNVSVTWAEAAGNDSERPPLWIEIGWQFERASGGQESFNPAFFDTIAANGFTSPLKLENALAWSYGADGKISFQPVNSDWIFSASVRYGRAHGHKSVHEQTQPGPTTVHIGTIITTVVNRSNVKFAQTKAANTETHAVLDFQAGKDVGLGLFGSGSTSVLGAGIRYAQIKYGSNTAITAAPDKYFATDLKYPAHVHSYHATNNELRSFKGLGPALSWTASAPLVGNPQDGEVAVDWGINAGLLFGKQKASGHHQTKVDYYKTSFLTGKYSYHHHGPVMPHNRSRSVMAPNLGGFAGLSLNWTNAKVSIGYRADTFFNAIDGGIDTRKSVNRGFYGPFASISIGMGD